MRKLKVLGVKVVINQFGVKIFTRNHELSQRIYRYLGEEGFLKCQK